MSSVNYTGIKMEDKLAPKFKATKAGGMRVVRNQRKPSQAKIKHADDKQMFNLLMSKAKREGNQNMIQMLVDDELLDKVEIYGGSNMIKELSSFIYKPLYEGAIEIFKKSKVIEPENRSLTPDEEQTNNTLDRAISMCQKYAINKSDLEFILTGFIPLEQCLNAVEKGYAPQNLMTCFLYALWQGGCDKQLIKELLYNCKESSIKYVKMKTWDPVMKDVGICVKIDKLDLDVDDDNRLRTFYIGKPYKEVVYDKVLNRYPNNDYFELGLIRSGKKDFGHYFFNAVCDVSPYFLDHYDELVEYSIKNSIHIKDLEQVNVKRNNKFYHDKTKMDTIRLIDLIYWMWHRNAFVPMSLNEVLFNQQPLSKK